MKIAKLIAVVAVMSLLLCAVPLSVAAEGSNSTTVATVIGYDENGVAVFAYPSQPKEAVLTGVSNLFDKSYPEIVRLVFAEGVKSVGNLGLDYCPNIAEVVLPQTLKVIDVYAFRHVSAALTDITIPSGVGYIAGMDAPRYDFYGGAPFNAGVILHGDRGSYAERYAAAHGLAFEPIVYTPSFGDVNADGLCNSTDARMVLQHAVEKSVLSEEVTSFADVNGDGAVDSTDARTVLQYAVGKGTVERIAVPTARATSDLISPQAEVYGFSWPTDDEYPDLPKCARNTLLTDNRREAIDLVNRVIGGSYYADGHALETLTQFSLTFVEPDGSRVEIQLRRSHVWALLYNGNVFGDLRMSKEARDGMIALLS